MSFEIRLNGQPFSLWKTAKASRSIDLNAGVFQFTNSTGLPETQSPVKAGDFVEILVSGVRKVAGFVDDVSGSGDDRKGNIVTFSGRDATADIIDSSVPDEGKVSEGPISLKALCEKVINSLSSSVKVIVEVEGLSEFTSEDLQAAGSGDSAMGYLVSFARKRQVYLVPDGSGNLVIFRPDKTNMAKSPLLHKINGNTNNVKTYRFRKSQQNRFNRYLCRSQDNFGFSISADYSGEGTNRNGEAIDSGVRASRYLEIQAEESMDDAECKERASEEANIRRVAGQEYIATVAGFTQNDGTVWDFGQFVTIDDDFADMKGEFLIRAVEWSVDISGGEKTTVTCVPPDAYQVTAEQPSESARSASTGTKLQQVTPPIQPAIRR
jgi:prophage tail gpP-like protein